MEHGNIFNKLTQGEFNARFIDQVKLGNFQRASSYLPKTAGGPGANIDTRDGKGDTMLIWCARQEGQAGTGTALLLVSRRCNLDAQDHDGNTAFMLACKNKNVELARALADAGADVTIENRHGEKPFNVAISSGVHELVELFERPYKSILSRIPAADITNQIITQKLNPNDIDPFGNRVLTWAAETGQESVAVAFLDAGADPRLTNAHGKTPLQIAKDAGNPRMVKIFEAAQTKPPVDVAPDAKPIFPKAQQQQAITR